jgi:GDP-4-dehydro-6-deoxy-D-mannose reductase
MGLLEALSAVPAPPRTLVAGSASVYGIPVASDGVVRESDPVAPVLFYGMTKAAQEDVFRLWARWGRVQPIFARSFNLTGPGEGTGSLPGAIARQLAAGADPILVGNLAPVRDFLDVRDAVAAYDLLSQRGEPGAAYNVASGRGESVRDHVARLVVAAGGSSRVVVDPDRVKAVDVAEVVADVSRLRALGWVPGFAPERTARDLLAAVRGGEGPWI